MPPEIAHFSNVSTRVAALNTRYRHHSAISVLEHALADSDTGSVAMVSSFGADSVVLLHMVALVDSNTPVLFLDTEMLFAETLQYQRAVADHLGLGDLRVIRASRTRLAAHDPEGMLHRDNPDACCALRKTEPLAHALAPFDAWITGRKRFQSGSRAALEFFEAEEDTRIKINPLAHWAREDVTEYMINNRLPRHPLVAQGYPSIGCAPCTTPVAPGEDPRAGRWRGAAKDECGIHIVDGRIMRAPVRQAS
ncbi:phosphoadenylyl-sulfate reductase [Roseicyclus sp.]|uniref:phosphoadenylyl-sulfate reductase n=1 Tax=Roseicyclus sp. TaxID=1914329 RepID=UPI003F6C11E6